MSLDKASGSEPSDSVTPPASSEDLEQDSSTDTFAVPTASATSDEAEFGECSESGAAKTLEFLRYALPTRSPPNPYSEGSRWKSGTGVTSHDDRYITPWAVFLERKGRQHDFDCRKRGQ